MIAARAALAPLSARRAAPLAAAAAGAIAALGQAPWGLWPLAILGAAAAMALASGAAPRRAAWIGWAFGFGHFLVALHWIVEPFLVDVARHGWMAPFALVLLAGAVAAYVGAAFWAAARLAPRAFLLAAPAAWTLAEGLRMHLFTGFPWAAPGQALIDTPLIGIASLGGPHALDLAVLGAAGLVAGAGLSGPSWRAGLLATAAAAALAAGWAWGAARDIPAAGPDAPVLRLVQPDAAQHLKWRGDMAALFTSRLIDAGAARPAPAAVIWPETAIPYWLDEAGPILEPAAAAAGAPILLGAQRFDGARSRNSAVLLDAQGAPAVVHDKHHLVPFGEYVPFAGLIGRLGLEAIAGGGLSGFAAGPGPGAIDLPGIGPAAILICYEAVFPAMLRLPERPRLAVQITNDAWFGRRAGPAQHLAQARLRAAETGLPLARAANTGITAMIDAGGRVTARMPPRVPGHLDAALPPALPPTAYVRAGDAPVLGAGALLLAIAAGLSRRRVLD